MAYDYGPRKTAQVMSSTRTTRRTAPGWLVGVLAATGTLVALGLVSLGFFASGGGLVIAGGTAIGIGTIAAAVADPPRAVRHTAIVAFYVVALAAAYLLALQNFVGLEPGARGGPGVDLPSRSGGSGVYPPPR